jgi:hypothetical protein
MTTKKYIIIVSALITLGSCKTPYNPPAITSAGSYLVVEGAINSGSDQTVIKLSRTVKLSSAVALTPESNAIVAVQSDQNVNFPLTETTSGNYVSAGLNLDISHKYRLSIKTANNEQYYSDYVPVLNSPPIDSVNFTVTNNGVNIYSNTHDATNSVKYYRWDFQETWIIHSNYDSGVYSNGDTVLIRPANEQIFTCWRNDTSSTIIINSSAKLAKNIISENPLTSIASTSEKLGNEYSILVRQYALTPDAYTFWTNLKKNTEQLGSIFDAEPSQINGNIHSVSNPLEPVIGYLSVGSTSSQRIFIKNNQLPAWVPTPAYPNCQLDTCLYVYYAPGAKLPVNQVNEFINFHKGAQFPLIPVAPISRPGSPPIGYSAADPICVDCTLRGTNIEPVFWKY